LGRVLDLTFILFNVLRVESQLHSYLALAFSKHMMKFVRQQGDPMSEEGNCNRIGKCGESLHRSQVVNATQLNNAKVAEFCLFV